MHQPHDAPGQDSTDYHSCASLHDEVRNDSFAQQVSHIQYNSLVHSLMSLGAFTVQATCMH